MRRIPASSPARILIALIAGIAMCCALAGPAAAASTPHAAAAASTPGATDSLNLLAGEISAYGGQLGPYRAGIWGSANTVCWACNEGGPASAAATLYKLTGDAHPELLQQAEATIDAAIATRQRRDGAFLGPSGDTQSPDVATMFFGVEEGNVYLELAPVLSPARRSRWQSSLAAAASYLIHNGNVTWYTNGNINLGNVELFYLVWRATGDERFHTAYEQAWSFLLNPPTERWPGRGLVIVKAPTRSDGADGSGYLTETGPTGTGFDPEYTELQLDVASRLYLISGDSRVLRLANLLMNMLLPRIETSDWLLDTSDGSRHTQPIRTESLITSAFAVLGLHGGRSDLVADIDPQLQAVASAYSSPGTASGAVFRRAIGNDVSVIALATNSKQPAGRLFSAVLDRAGASRRRSRKRPHHR